MSKCWKTLVVAVVAAGGASSVAIADGYEPVGKGFAPPAAFSWSGVYGGAHGGYGWGDSEIDETTSLSTVFQGSHDVEGGLGGVHLGMNKQFGNFVAGAELRLSGAQIDGSSNECIGAGGNQFVGGGDQLACETQVNWIATALARLGYAQNRWLVYGTLGWAVAGVKYETTLIDPLIRIPLGGVNETNDGIAFGGGFEYAFSNSVIVGVEYTRINLDNGGPEPFFSRVEEDFFAGDRELELNTIIGRLSYKWGG